MKLPFSKISISQAIHKILFHQNHDKPCVINKINFLKLLSEEYSFLLSKKYVKKAFVIGYPVSLGIQNKLVLNGLKKFNPLKLFSKKEKVLFFQKTLTSLKHSEHKYILNLLFNNHIELISYKKVRNSLGVLYCIASVLNRESYSLLLRKYFSKTNLEIQNPVYCFKKALNVLDDPDLKTLKSFL